MTIHIASKNDLSEILALQKSCYLEEAELYKDYQIPPLTQTLESIGQDYDKGIILKIEAEKRILGSVRGCVENNTCKIGRLIVHSKFRNQGLGKKLMRAIESHFDNVHRFELFTGHKSEKNLGLYKKLGYAEFKRERISEKLELVFLEKMNNIN